MIGVVKMNECFVYIMCLEEGESIANIDRSHAMFFLR